MSGTSSAQASRPLQLGFFDGVYNAAPAERDPWLDRSVAVGAGIVRVDVGWPAPTTATRPAGFDARNPADRRYDFARADAAIIAARSRGLQVLAGFAGAPPWVDGSGRPPGVTPGTWRPSARAFEEYGAALARRYSGSFPDPTRPGQTLPKVKAFQVWNEPNLSKYLSPQWSGRRATAPITYRRMLNGFYRGAKSVDRGALVVTAGTAPFGDPQVGGNRIQPARFWRELLCLRRSKGALRGSTCPSPARFDILSHHPYSVGRPRRKALNADDVSIPDLGKLTTLLRAAEGKHRALPRKRHPVWVTEISYDSSPPDPDGVAEATHARWLQEALYLLWRQGVNTITWLHIRDQLPVPSFAASNQSGVFLNDGQAKLAAQAFRLPLVAERVGRTNQLRVWGRSPKAGRLTIDRAAGDRWDAVRTITVRRGGTYFVRIARRTPRDRLRVRIGSETSLTWAVR